MVSNMLKGTLCVNPNQARCQHITQTQWKCPPEFTIDSNWRVAAGEESTEAVTQTRVAPDPRHYEAGDQYDSRTPVIPITPIDEEGNLLDNSSVPFLTTFAMTGETMSLAVAAVNALNDVALCQGESPNSMGLFMHWLNSDTVRRYLRGQSVPGMEPASMLNEPTHSVPSVSSNPDQLPAANVVHLPSAFGHSTPLMNTSSFNGNTQVVGQGPPMLKPPHKLCIFFNTPRECQYGASCRYLHSKSDQA